MSDSRYTCRGCARNLVAFTGDAPAERTPHDQVILADDATGHQITLCGTCIRNPIMRQRHLGLPPIPVDQQMSMFLH